MMTIKKEKETTSTDKDVEKFKPLYFANNYINNVVSVENSWTVLQKGKYRITI